MDLARRAWPLGVCFLLYIPFAGAGIYRSGYNPDEWRFIAGEALNFADVAGRWATHLGHNVLFGGKFLAPLQITLTFICLFSVSVLLARRVFLPGWTGPITVALFFAGSNHPYLTEMLHYESLCFWFSLGLLCSTVAMAIIEPRQRRIGRLHGVGVLLVAGQLVALSIALYQSYALVGLLLPAVALIRVDLFDDRRALTYVGSALFVAVLAFALYRIELRLVLDWLGLEARPRFRMSSLSEIREKITWYPRLLRRLHTGEVMGMPRAAQLFLLLGSLSAVACTIASAWMAFTGRLKAAGRSLVSGLRIVVGTCGAMFLLPSLFWFIYPEIAFLARTAGFFGFGVASVLFANAALVAPNVRRASLSNVVPILGVVLVVAYGVAGSWISAALWSMFRESAQRDLDLAKAILARVRQLDAAAITRAPIHLVGGVSYDDLRFGRFTTPGTFEAVNAWNSIFQGLAGSPAPSGSMPVSPRPCPAFPDEGSVFVEDGVPYVCLRASGVLPELAECYDLNDGSRGSLCFTSDIAVLRAADCDTISTEYGDVIVSLLGDDGRFAGQISFRRAGRPFMLKGLCYRFGDMPAGDFTALEVEQGEAGTRPRMRQKFARPIAAN